MLIDSHNDPLHRQAELFGCSGNYSQIGLVWNQPVDIIAAHFWLETHAQERGTTGLGYGFDLFQVGIHFAAGIVDVVEQGAR